ncbi:MAG: hypothetical protein JKY67_02820 [Pseudomonadales bacterium]|nr:hypothetical protein [Pseudomonadales bacterium]
MPGADKQDSKSIAREAAQLALRLHTEQTREQIKQIAKEDAQEAVKEFHERYDLHAEDWVFLKELRIAHKNTSSWVKKLLIIALLTISLSFGADAIVNELKIIFHK